MKKRQQGTEVSNWQLFLKKQGLYNGKIDGDFWNLTHAATVLFQRKHKLKPDGWAGEKTIAKAKELGFMMPEKPTNDFFPQKPSFSHLTGNQREEIFGKIEYKPTPTKRNEEKITITNNFEKDNIVMVKIPQLAKATNGKYTRMRFHKKAKYQLLKFWEEIEKEGLLHLVVSYAGAYYPRFIRGSISALSNHSYGTAFDINAEYNGLGQEPAKVGEKGSLLKLVKIANKWGFYWGGHFARKDGMHFEVAFIIEEENN